MQRGEGTQREASGYRRQGGDAARLPPKLVHKHRNKYGLVDQRALYGASRRRILERGEWVSAPGRTARLPPKSA